MALKVLRDVSQRANSVEQFVKAGLRLDAGEPAGALRA